MDPNNVCDPHVDSCNLKIGGQLKIAQPNTSPSVVMDNIKGIVGRAVLSALTQPSLASDRQMQWER